MTIYIPMIIFRQIDLYLYVYYKRPFRYIWKNIDALMYRVVDRNTIKTTPMKTYEVGTMKIFTYKYI